MSVPTGVPGPYRLLRKKCGGIVETGKPARTAVIGLVTAGALGCASVLQGPPMNDEELRADRYSERFRYQHDEVLDVGWFTVPWSGFAMQRLEPVVRHDGLTYLRSRCAMDQWIFHTLVRVRIGDTLITSAEVPGYDPANDRRVRSGGGILEVISFTGGRDHGILHAIAAAPDSVRIIVRFEGSDRVATHTLSGAERRDIVAAVSLARLLRSGVWPSTWSVRPRGGK